VCVIYVLLTHSCEAGAVCTEGVSLSATLQEDNTNSLRREVFAELSTS
jgi:hypothetical protein